MKKTYWLLSLIFLFCLGIQGQTARHAAIVLTHVTVIDTTGGPSHPDMTVVVTGDRISAVGKTRKVKIPKDAEVVNVTGKFLIPGLWDMHTHNFFGPKQSTLYSLYIANGITGVRDMGGEWKYYDSFRKQQRDGVPLKGQWPAPRIVAAGVILDGKPPIHPSNLVVTTPEEARAAVDLCKRRGVDFIKVYNMLNRPSYFAIAAESKKVGLPFVGHVPWAVSAAEASDAGQKSIEHSDGILLAASTQESQLRKQLLARMQGGKWGTAQLELAERIPDTAVDSYSPQKAGALFARFTKNGTWVCPTLVVNKRLLTGARSEEVNQLAEKYVPGMANGFWKILDKIMQSTSSEDMAGHKKRYEKYVAIVPIMHRAGVQLLAGTDTTNPYVIPGFSLHEELELLVGAGLTPMEALQTATINPARFLGKENDLGTVQKGKLADLVLLDADPLADIHNTEKIDAVVVNGRLLKKDDLQKMLNGIAAANQAK